MSKPALIGSLVTFLVGLLLIVFARDISETITAPFLVDETSNQTVKLGGFDDIQGPVFLKSNSAVREVRLNDRLELRHLDQIRTENGGSVVVSLAADGPGWRIQILGSSTVIFESYRPKTPNSPVLLSMVRGDYQILQEGKPGMLFINRDKKIFLPQNKPTAKLRSVTIQPATPTAPPAGVAIESPAAPAAPEALPNDAPVAPAKTALPSAKRRGPMPDKLPVGDEETLTSPYIEGVLAQEAASFRRCQMNSVRDSRPSIGSLLVSLTIQATGSVQEARVLQNEMGNDALGQCVLSAIKRVKFKAFEGIPITLTYPIEFK